MGRRFKSGPRYSHKSQVGRVFGRSPGESPGAAGPLLRREHYGRVVRSVPGPRPGSRYRAPTAGRRAKWPDTSWRSRHCGRGLGRSRTGVWVATLRHILVPLPARTLRTNPARLLPDAPDLTFTTSGSCLLLTIPPHSASRARRDRAWALVGQVIRFGPSQLPNQ
jgi:hypothetical protein